MSQVFFKGMAQIGSAVGKGVIAGLAGTVAITISQMIEMKITKRSMSSAPMVVGGRTLGVEPKGEAEAAKVREAEVSEQVLEPVQKEVKKNKQKFSQIMHFSYGTSWGIFRGALDLAGLTGPLASTAHFGAIWGAAQVMLPANNASPPITEWSAQQITLDLLHHAVYAYTAGATYDAMVSAEKC